MTVAASVLVGILIGVVMTLAVMKVGDWLVWRNILPHLEAALDARHLPAETVDVRTIDALDVYLDALDRHHHDRQRPGRH